MSKTLADAKMPSLKDKLLALEEASKVEVLVKRVKKVLKKKKK